MSLRWTEKDLAAHQARRKVVSSDQREPSPPSGRSQPPARSGGDSGRLPPASQAVLDSAMERARAIADKMDAPIIVVLSGEPRGKGRPRSRIATSRGGQQFIAVYTPKETRDYERALASAGMAAMRGRPPLAGPIEVVVLAVMSVPRSWPRARRDAALVGTIRPTGKPDVDNVLKCLDGLNGIVFQDDSQIVGATINKRYGEEPMLRVEVRGVGVFDA